MKLKAALVLLIITACPVFAGLTVTPSRMEFTLKRGETKNAAYSIRNEYGVPIELLVETKDWFVLKENKEKGIDVSKWLEVSTASFHLGANESKDIVYKISVPDNAEGVMVGMISFIPKTADLKGVSLLISVPVYVTVAGTEKIDWEITEVKLSGYQGQLQLYCTIINNGNVHLRASGYAEVLAGNRKIADYAFLEGRPAYPGTSRTLVAKIDPALKEGKYKIKIHLNCEKEEKTLTKTAVIKNTGEIILK